MNEYGKLKTLSLLLVALFFLFFPCGISVLNSLINVVEISNLNE